MAKFDGFEPRLRFLKEAAHLLAIASPTTSATLGAERDRLLQSQEADIRASKKEWDAHRREVCGACGNLMIPGWSCEVSSQSPRKHDKQSNQNKSKQLRSQEKAMVYSCLRCHRKTTQSLPSRPPMHLKRKSDWPQELTSSVEARESRTDYRSKILKSANVSSKQRAKARKGGLQAILAKSKAQNAGLQQGLGLDLMDFMQ
ncbi:uncharacterized protein BDR25DRAFT_366880 [Lindgomyces ingoldianus]|uniref:Uncharacterized protein n=1 Tax=Lindgomyces ingoldianus TaxID=673940 RepID=A0ACB6R000_9PLEO|nr:uncharacterized protein BDR25DRAFT_366880 [Lindgomyces ingoldianus]KAF2472120.1 hypothetical protein BDR25DRAFT_366880 [Lindgomyces ingoldianus]